MANIYFRSKQTSLIILAVTAIVLARVPFLLFDDPEGPNLLIVGMVTLAVYFLSLAIYIFTPTKMAGVARIFGAVFIQIIIIAGLYLWLK